MPHRNEIVEAARSLLGTPFKHQGRAPGVELDCAGVIISAAAKCDITLSDVACYAPNPDGKTLVEHLNSVLEPILAWEAQVGDVVVMSFERWPTHLALITSNEPLTVLHANRQAGKVIEHRLDGKWAARIVRAFHIPGVVD